MLVSAAQEIRKQRSEKEEERQHGNSTQQPVVGNNAPAPVFGLELNEVDSNGLLVEHDMSVTLEIDLESDAALINEVDSYLSCRTATNIDDGLKNFPNITEIFKKFNSIRTSEAICELLYMFRVSSRVLSYMWCWLWHVAQVLFIVNRLRRIWEHSRVWSLIGFGLTDFHLWE
ncbi:uncharacterized protein LOC129571548 [Sitodiplosis mosellana]|uniref:uncharacterized protein LOC129571548 n=1 Tax=Sitodiplosis mosellana TaxID=263140 RepID=UPI00244458A0|nr:uncharacterized protein LOC129571548 [Sitodiplosis mosellana]